MSRAVLILLVAAGTAAAARPALADPMVTITPPAGPGVRAYRNDFRTTDRQPLFRIAGTGGTTLQCGLDDATTSPCDAADTACIAAVCATYRPPGALGGGSHTLSVQLDDAHGAEVAENSFDFVVDTTPPDTIGVSADGPALRPVFSFTVDEDDTLAPADTAQCSFTPIGAPTVWTGCATGLSLTGTGLDGGYRVPVPLPRRHADYRFMARGIDDFGRMDPTPAQYVYDPVPCAVAARPASIAAVIAGGLPLTVSCSSVRRVRLDLRVSGRNGTRAGRRVAGHRGARWSEHLTMRLSSRAAAALRSASSATFFVSAVDAAAGSNRLPAYSVITVRR